MIPDERSADRGSATVASVAVLWLAAMLTVAVGVIGRSLADTTRAASVADAVALAGVAGGRAGAERVARANDAGLVEYSDDGIFVAVRVQVGGATATAAAAPASIH